MQVLAAGEALWDGDGKVSAVQHGRGHQVMLRAQDDLALDTHLAQGQVDIAETAAAAGDVDVRQRQVLLQADLLLGQRVAAAHGADVAVLDQLDVAHLGVGVERGVHGEVEAAGSQFLGGFAAL
ncbi:hypothetical protein D3C84_853550 [compost metagenome]